MASIGVSHGPSRVVWLQGVNLSQWSAQPLALGKLDDILVFVPAPIKSQMKTLTDHHPRESCYPSDVCIRELLYFKMLVVEVAMEFKSRTSWTNWTPISISSVSYEVVAFS